MAQLKTYDIRQIEGYCNSSRQLAKEDKKFQYATISLRPNFLWMAMLRTTYYSRFICGSPA